MADIQPILFPCIVSLLPEAWNDVLCGERYVLLSHDFPCATSSAGAVYREA
jgi:hypothetical protein